MFTKFMMFPTFKKKNKMTPIIIKKTDMILSTLYSSLSSYVPNFLNAEKKNSPGKVKAIIEIEKAETNPNIVPMLSMKIDPSNSKI